MCRWMAYCGPPLYISDLLFDVDNSLIDQAIGRDSLRPADREVNADGFGVGYFDGTDEPGLYRTTEPAWDDSNGRDLAAHIKSPLFLAHVRSATTGAIQEANCHPFRHEKTLFVHNGEISRFPELRRELTMAVEPELFPSIQGTTDSEILFYLALSFGLGDPGESPAAAIQGIIRYVESTAKIMGVGNALDMTLGIASPDGLCIVRYATAGEPPTLYATDDPEHLLDVNPHLQDRPGFEALKAGGFRLVVSEPVGNAAEKWEEIEAGTVRTFDRSGKELNVSEL